ncbi:MAG: ABC transporter permease [Streptosporangiaceae bacterium]
MASSAAAVWNHREVLALFVRRDLKAKYQQSVLGYAWSMLEPLLLTGVYFFVFAQILHAGTENYGLFLVAGILPWLWFNRAVHQSTRILLGDARIITTMALPRELFPLGTVGAKFVEFILSLPVLVVFAVIAWVPPHVTILGFLLAIPLQAILTTGITMILSSVTVLVRDVQRVIQVALRMTFFMSGVLYPVDKVPESVRGVFELNPLVTIFGLYRAAWFPEDFPSAHLLVETSLICLAVFLVGWWMFHALEPAVLKEL